jgi:hypothetical protein
MIRFIWQRLGVGICLVVMSPMGLMLSSQAWAMGRPPLELPKQEVLKEPLTKSSRPMEQEVQIPLGCEDSDQGENFAVAGQALSRPLISPRNMWLDHCLEQEKVVPTANDLNALRTPQRINSRLEKDGLNQGSWWSRFRRTLRLIPKKLFTDNRDPLAQGLHDGSYSVLLEEAICDISGPTTVQYNCSATQQSCVQGRCQSSQCTMDITHNVAHYQGFPLDESGKLQEAKEVSQEILACRGETLITSECRDVPQDQYVVIGLLGDRFMANQGERYLRNSQKECQGRNVEIPSCIIDLGLAGDLIDLTLSGCVSKDKIIRLLDRYPGTGRAIRRLRNAPDFAYCAEDMPDLCNDPDRNPAQTIPSDDNVEDENEAELPDPDAAAPVTAGCFRLAGDEPGNTCSPSHNGVKVVQENGATDIYCNRCLGQGSRMYQYLCSTVQGYTFLDENIVDCGGQKCIREEGRCRDCQDPSQDWCGEVLE